MCSSKTVKWWCAVLALWAGTAPPMASGQAEPDDDYQPVTYTRTGADTCLKCHDEDNVYPVFPIFETAHARTEDARTPFAQLQCESCHGPGDEHSKRKRKDDEAYAPMLFGPRSLASVGEQNGVCLQCHAGRSRIGWQASAHANQDLRCVDCHRVHVTRDPVLATRQQPAVCLECHTRQRARLHWPSTHPVRAGQMSCSSCHNTHDDFAPDALVRPTLNETCFSCHADKRGPFLWPHAPAAEDCGTCHAPHGSINRALLTKRPPQLCRQCHSQAGHPSLSLDGDALRNDFTSRFLLAKGCLNCHSQVHGSNHPSGGKLMR